MNLDDHIETLCRDYFYHLTNIPYGALKHDVSNCVLNEMLLKEGMSTDPVTVKRQYSEYSCFRQSWMGRVHTLPFYPFEIELMEVPTCVTQTHRCDIKSSLHMAFTHCGPAGHWVCVCMHERDCRFHWGHMAMTHYYCLPPNQPCLNPCVCVCNNQEYFMKSL